MLVDLDIVGMDMVQIQVPDDLGVVMVEFVYRTVKTVIHGEP